ncbi:MAG: Uncharacterized protein G01um101472_65 [Parcubacteria group bacterium Gr01-1014_72]|nr:MAG: Uncharacterized protein G01um101472_65 [Parcubacteria group bacterium Gr01-1014_72]
MRLSLKGTQLSITPAIREYLEKRLAALARHINLEDSAVLLQVELGRTTRHHHTGDVFRAEINLYRGKESFRAEAEAQDLYAAIDEVRDEIIREVTGSKEKRLSLLRRGGQKVKDILRGLYRLGRK